ncbi:MAG: DoxX family membrane protein [Candidatus Omnitrophica bacterium]|nr:DoxX family membrane protein [Candidatus Omnitrophota bacterium]
MKKTEPLLLLTARFMMGGVFAYAGFAKLREPPEWFLQVLEQYALIPHVAVPVLARVIPWLEWLLGAMLLSGYLCRFSALSLSVFSLFSIVLTGYQFFAGQLPEECGCFGSGTIELTPAQSISLNLFLVFSGLLLFMRTNHPYSLDAVIRKRAA